MIPKKSKSWETQNALRFSDLKMYFKIKQNLFIEKSKPLRHGKQVDSHVNELLCNLHFIAIRSRPRKGPRKERKKKIKKGCFGMIVEVVFSMYSYCSTYT